MSWFVIVYRVLFLLHFISNESHGKIISPPDGTKLTIVPGGNGSIIWKFDDDINTVSTRSWSFKNTDGSRSWSLGGTSNSGPSIQPGIVPGISIKNPATLVLNNVNKNHDGIYTFSLVTTASFISSVRVFIAKKPTLTLNCYSVALNEDDNFICECKGLGGNPPASVTWYKDGNQMQERGPIITTQEPSIPNTSEKSTQNGLGNGCDSSGPVVVWHIVVALLSGFIIGILFSYIVLYFRRRWCKNTKPERNSEPKTDGVDTTYQELDLTRMNTEDNYQSLRGNTAASVSNYVVSVEEATYTQLSKTRDVEDNYQSLS